MTPVFDVIDVVGLGDGGLEELPPRSRTLIRSARVLVGGRRHLDLVPNVPGQQRHTWPSPLLKGLPVLLAELGLTMTYAVPPAPARTPAGESRGGVVALASGDPLRSGIGSTLVRMLGAERVRIHPWLSSDTLARARMGWSAEECEVLTVVGRSVEQLRAHLDPGARLVVLCSDGLTPARVAALLVGEGCGDSALTAWWHLGGVAEGSRRAPAYRWDEDPTPDLVVVCVEVEAIQARRRAALGTAPGLPEAAYDSDGQLTKRDARASALAHLRPHRGGVLWDLGAGTGTVGLEWARAAAGATTLAVERRPDRAGRIRSNASRLGVPDRVEVLEADVLEAVSVDRPSPDAVFIGGGLTLELLAAAWVRLVPGGRLVAHAVTLEAEQVLVAAWRQHGGDLTRLAVEHAEPLGRLTGWRPARPIVQWSACKEAP